MFAEITQGRSGDLPFSAQFKLIDTEAACAVMRTKVRVLRLILGQADAFQPDTKELEQHLLDLGLVCGELAAIVQATKKQMRDHQQHTAEALSEATGALLEAYNYLAAHAMQGPPSPRDFSGLNPNKDYWEVVPMTLYYVAWEAIGKPNLVSADRPATS